MLKNIIPLHNVVRVVWVLLHNYTKKYDNMLEDIFLDCPGQAFN